MRLQEIKRCFKNFGVSRYEIVKRKQFINSLCSVYEAGFVTAAHLLFSYSYHVAIFVSIYFSFLTITAINWNILHLLLFPFTTASTRKHPFLIQCFNLFLFLFTIMFNIIISFLILFHTSLFNILSFQETLTNRCCTYILNPLICRLYSFFRVLVSAYSITLSNKYFVGYKLRNYDWDDWEI